MNRRLISAAGAVACIGAGLLWRSHWLPWPRGVAKYGGDAFWALTVFFIVRTLAPRLGLWAQAGWALGFSFVIEFSQLYHAPWIDAVRRWRVGHLVLGTVFNAPDFLAYTGGVLFGVLLTWRAKRIT